MKLLLKGLGRVRRVHGGAVRRRWASCVAHADSDIDLCIVADGAAFNPTNPNHESREKVDCGFGQRLTRRVIAAKSRAAAKNHPARRWTFEELAAELPESNLPTELWDGELIMSPAPSFFHQEIVDRFHDRLKAWVRKHRLGKTGIAPLDMVLTIRRAVQPDILFVANERLSIIRERVMGAADLVAEVLSPDSRRRDRFDKRDLYEQHGVREYWLIDPEAQTVEVLHLEAGQYQLVGRWRPGEQTKSRLPKGFSVSVSELFGAS